MYKIIPLEKPEEDSEDLLTELLRNGACKLITEAVESDLQILLEQFSSLNNEQGANKQSWSELLLRMEAQRLKSTQELAVGDGALGFWKVLNKLIRRLTLQHQPMGKSTQKPLNV